jgi:nuclear transcription factor Y alpha
MKCLCEKDSAHSTSHHVFGCPSWGTSSESEVQQTSMSKSLSFKVEALPQKCHNSKALSFQFQEQDSSSTQSSGSSQSGILIETLSIRVILCLSTGVFSFYSAIGVYMSTVKLQYSPLNLYLAPRLQIKGVFGV